MGEHDAVNLFTALDGLFKVLTLLGVLSGLFLSWLAKSHAQEGVALAHETKVISQENKAEVAEVKDLVNGQRHALELRIAALETKLETATETAIIIAKEKADLATELALQVAQTATAVAKETTAMGSPQEPLERGTATPRIISP